MSTNVGMVELLVLLLVCVPVLIGVIILAVYLITRNNRPRVSQSAVKTCPNCGRQIPVDSVFCAYCGTSLAPPGEAEKPGAAG